MSARAHFSLRVGKDRQWIVEDADETYCALTGYVRAQLTGRTIDDLWGGLARPIQSVAAKVTLEQFPDTIEAWFPVPRGRQWHRLSAAKMGDRLLITVMDITQERESNENAFRVLTQCRDILYSMALPDYRIVYTSSSITAVVGFTVQEILEDPFRWQHIIHPEDRVTVAEGLERVVQTGRVENQFRGVLDTGEVRQFANRMVLVRDAEGNPWRVDGVISDVTDQSQQLGIPDDHRSHTDVVLRMTKDYRIISCNAAYASIYGLVPAEVIGQNLLDLVTPQEASIISAKYSKLVKEGGIFHEEAPKRGASGAMRWYRWTGIAITDAYGEVTEIQAVGQDITTAKEMELALKESRIRFSLAATGNNDGIWDWDMVRGQLWLSTNFKEQLGYEETALPPHSTSLAGLIHREDYAEFLAQIERYRQGRIPRIDLVQRYYHVSGAEIHFHCRAIGERNEAGELIRLVGTNTNITRIVRAENRLKDAIEVISEGFVLFDPQDRVVLHNDQFFYTPALSAAGDLTGKTFGEIARIFAYGDVTDKKVGDDPEAWIAWRIAQHNNPSAEPYEQQLTDGRWMRIHERRTSDGGWVGIWTDITALKKAELRLRDAIEAINDGFLLLDNDFTIITCNSRLQELYPISAPLLKPGMPLAEVLRYGAIHGEYPGVTDIDAFIEEALRLIRPDRPVVYEREVANGRWLLSSQQHTSNGDIVGTRTDITSQKEKEAELRMARNAADQANAAKSRFLAHMSHELRTPLNAILGFTDVMRNGVFGAVGDPRYLQYLNFIYESGFHLLSLINDILDLSKVEAGKRELVIEEAVTQELAHNCLQIVIGQARDKNITLRYDPSPRCTTLRCDVRAVKQIIINLLSNAVKFTLANGVVDLELDTEGDYYRIRVTDSGIGMAEEDIPRAFDPFGQIESDLARSVQGTGLGLPLVKSLVELHGGYIDIASTVGKGTSITIYLPVHGQVIADQTRHVLRYREFPPAVPVVSLAERTAP